MGVEVKQKLERDYDIHMTMNNVRALTFNKLKELEGGVVDVTEIEIVQEYLTKDQLKPSTDIVVLNSRESDKKIFIIHPITGVVDSLKTIASHLKCAVYGIQYTSCSPATNMNDLAKFYIEKLQTIQNTGPFHVVGYSYGAAVAVEMALQLEACEPIQLGSLNLLDGSPSVVKNITHNETRGSMDNAENNAMCSFLLMFIPIDPKQISEEFNLLPNLDSKVKRTVEELFSKGGFDNKEDIDGAVRAYWARLWMGDKYKLNGKISLNHVRLFQATESNFDSAGNDYGLGEICKMPVEVIKVYGNHRTILEGEGAKQIADLINQSMNI